ncbi:MAG: PAS domain S-box protein [Candidatus Peregrinibacteria bacterium GW2011_GWC2_39_14]|nr:MAG: PAS domain S-box protein [Candidatus Peregrinibacteria bacterium GW2011_GWC2_39_14]
MKKSRNNENQIPTELINKIQNNFCKTLDIALAIYNVNGNNITKEMNLSTFWNSFILGNPLVYPKCKAADINAIKTCISSNDSHVYNIYCDIAAFAVPISIEGKVIAVCIGGKSRTENPNLKLCKTEAENSGINFDTFLEAYLEIPLVSTDQLKLIGNLLKNTIETILDLNLNKKHTKSKIDEMQIMNDMLKEEVYSRTKILYETNQKYKSIVENAIDIIATINKNGIFTEINSAVNENLGFMKEEVIGMHFSKLVAQEDIPKIAKMIESFVSHGIDKESMIISCIDAQENEKIFSISAKPIYDNLGNLTEIQCIMHDITKRKLLEKELHKTKDEYVQLFDSIKDGVYSVDLKGNLLKTNESFSKIFGYEKEDLKKITIWSLFTDQKEAKDFIDQIENTKESSSLITTAKNNSEKEFYIEWNIAPVNNEKGNPIGHNGVIRDITSRMKYISTAKTEATKYQSLFDNLQEGVIITNEKGEIKEYNQKIAHIFRRQISIGIHISELIPEITCDKVQRLAKKGQIDIGYIKEFAISGVKLEVEGEILFQWMMKEVCKVDYTREKGAINNVPLDVKHADIKSN